MLNTRNNSYIIKGFTLIELMIVVAIIGVLAAVAVPGFSKYLRVSKQSEGKGLLNSLGQGAIVFYNAEHILDSAGLLIKKDYFPGCEETGEPTACADVRSFEGTRDVGLRISPNDPSIKLNEIPWNRLNISINKPFLYILSYSSDPTPATSTFTATAIASLETDDDSILKIEGAGNGGGIKMTIGNITVIKDGE